jgi:hypothetical protein
MMNVRLLLSLLLSVALVATEAMCLTEDQLKRLDEETHKYVLAEQERIKATSASRQELEQQRLRTKEEVFNWSLEQKIEVLGSDNLSGKGVSENLVREMLHAELLRENGLTWSDDQADLSSLRDQMEVLRPYIIELSESESSLDKSYAVKLGRYLNVDESIESMFYDVLDSQVESEEGGVREVLDVIFAYKLDTPELRNELVQGLALDHNSDNPSRFTSEAELNAGRWGLFEAADALILLVEDHYQLEGKVNRTALKSLKELGPSAVDVLPRLEKLLEMRRADGDADFREIEALEYAIFSVSKGLPKKAETTALTSTNPPEETTTLEPVNEETAEVVTVEPIEEPVEQSSQWWLWLIGAMVAFGGIGWLVRSK